MNELFYWRYFYAKDKIKFVEDNVKTIKDYNNIVSIKKEIEDKLKDFFLDYIEHLYDSDYYDFIDKLEMIGRNFYNRIKTLKNPNKDELYNEVLNSKVIFNKLNRCLEYSKHLVYSNEFIYKIENWKPSDFDDMSNQQFYTYQYYISEQFINMFLHNEKVIKLIGRKLSPEEREDFFYTFLLTFPSKSVEINLKNSKYFILYGNNDLDIIEDVFVFIKSNINSLFDSDMNVKKSPKFKDEVKKCYY